MDIVDNKKVYIEPVKVIRIQGIDIVIKILIKILIKVVYYLF